MVGALIWLFIVILSTTAFVVLMLKKDIVLSWKIKRDSQWTTYYKSGCMHLVPEESKFHSIEEDGDCQCHTSVDQYGITKVYQHQRLGV